MKPSSGPPSRSKVILVTGASSGIGRSCAEHLAGLGHTVFGASRRRMEALPGVEPVRLDVDDEASVQSGVARVLAQAGRIDVLLHCAGYVLTGAIEETSVEEAKAQLDTNFFGAVRMARAVLPGMREQGSGVIINVASIAGLIPLPYQAYYGASKAALQNWTEGLDLEVYPFGISALCINPGDYQTAITQNRRRAQASLAAGGPHAALRGPTLAKLEHDEAQAQPPNKLGAYVAGLIERPKRRGLFLVGPAVQQLAVLLRSLLPRRAFLAGLSRYLRAG